MSVHLTLATEEAVNPCLPVCDYQMLLQVLADKPMVLVGSLRNDCQSATKEVSVTWSEETATRVPACNVPGFSELYMVACSGFAERVESVCSIRFEDVLLVSFLSFGFPLQRKDCRTRHLFQ